MKNILIILSVAFLFSCSSSTSESTEGPTEVDLNPPAEGFNLEGSDQKAIEIADNVMQAMGGRKAWDATRTICWNFFGGRQLIWDKWTGDVRIDSFRDTTTYLLNVNTMKGKVAKKGVVVTDEEELTSLLKRGKAIWINDSYWLVMPFKLKDSGVTLRYLREEPTMDGKSSDVLQLTFEDVGVTPENKYEVWISKEDSLVRQWYYFPTDTSEARIKTVWGDYQKYGKLLLSGNRGERGLTDIHVFEEMPAEVFNSFDPVDLDEM